MTIEPADEREETRRSGALVTPRPPGPDPDELTEGPTMDHPSVTLDGEVVHRAPYSNGPFVRRVLRRLADDGFAGAPRLVRVAENGRETVTFVPGTVFEAEPLLSDAQVASLGRLLRRAHDALAGSDLADGRETVCHGDAGPHNVVFRGDEAVALIDWEDAVPGNRLEDVADVAWCLLDERWQHEPPDGPARRIALLCRGYDGPDVPSVVDALTARVRAARDEHARDSAVASVAHFDRLLGWLAKHNARLRSGRG